MSITGSFCVFKSTHGATYSLKNVTISTAAHTLRRLLSINVRDLSLNVQRPCHSKACTRQVKQIPPLSWRHRDVTAVIAAPFRQRHVLAGLNPPTRPGSGAHGSSTPHHHERDSRSGHNVNATAHQGIVKTGNRSHQGLALVRHHAAA